MRLLEEKKALKQDIAIITAGQETRDPQMAVGQDGEILWGTTGNHLTDEKLADAARIALGRGLARNVIASTETGQREFQIEIHCGGDALLIAGAGNMSSYVYQYACILGLEVTIFDNRAEILTRERFPEARELILGDMAANMASYPITEDASIVIVSHNHKFDEEILKSVMDSPARYVGMLGNKRKVAAMFEHMRAMGTAEEAIAKVHAPIGLDLGGKKTTEIALAIMAEIQAVKYGRR